MARTPLSRHQEEILKNLNAWQKKPLLQAIYKDYAEIIKSYLNINLNKPTVEIGAGVGNLKHFIKEVIAADLFPNPWIDIVFNAYQIPFSDETLSNVFIFDVFHHLEKPMVFLKEAWRVLSNKGRLIMIEPYISLTGFVVYGLFHHEKIGWFDQIDFSDEKIPHAKYYAAQGNSTRIFFRNPIKEITNNWTIIERKRLACISYILSGGYSKPRFYPAKLYPMMKKIDAVLSLFPSIFACRCLIVLEKR